MAILRHGLFLLLFLSFFLVARSQQPDPAPAKISVPNIFSYQAPAGWQVDAEASTNYPVVVLKAGPEVKALIAVNMDIAPLPLAEWCSKSLAQNKEQFAKFNARMGELEPFKTAAAEPGFRATVDLTSGTRQLHYVMYFFNGAGNAKLAVTCTCPAQEVDHYSAIFEAAMKTFVPH